ncbi:MAG: DUF4159 domain-containing protein [Chlorobi bacterium]|nr:DUF4159 domain-containing protein [Chlorobiota bacterium]
MRYKLTLLIIFLSLFGIKVQAQSSYQIARLKYNGGGDWYANPTSLPNLIKFCNKNLHTSINKEPATVEVGSPEIFNYPFLHMTGHGNVIFSVEEQKNLRTYLLGGGFLHIDDNYGMDKYIRREIKKLFPGRQLVELPYSHPIFHQKYDFPNGLPKIHKHNGKRPQAFGIFFDNRLVLLYTYECDLGNGWEDTEVYHDPVEKHLQALKAGANIIQYVFTE